MAQPQHSPLPLVIALLLLVVIGVLVHLQQQTIPVVPASADATVFSGARAYTQLRELLRENQPHPVDTPANRRVEARIVERLRELGYREEIQAGTVCRSFDRGEIKLGLSRCARVRNIIVHLPGRESGNGILLSAHYDSVPAAPGASDAGAAVATLLEIARLLNLQAQPRNDIVLLFNEGEETGLLGAKLFMEQHPLARQLQVAINIEARGTTSRSVLFETGENSGWLIKHYAASTPAPLSSSLFYEIYKVLPNDTDLTIFKQHGLQGVNFAHVDNEAHYHTPLDNLTNLDRGSLQHHGDNAWGILKHIKDSDISQAEPGNRVYTDILGLVLISWPEALSIWIVLALAAVFITQGVILFRRRQWQPRAALWAFGLLVLTTLSCLVLSYGAQWLVQNLSGHSQPWRAHSLAMEMGIWLLCLSVGLVFGLWSRRFQTAGNVLIALQFWWLLFAIGSGVYLPGVSFLFILPLAVSFLATVAWLVFPKLQALQTQAFLSLPISAGIIFLPIAYFIEISLGFQLAAAVALFLSFIVVSLLPLPALTQVNKKPLAVFSLTAATVSLVGLIWTTLQAPYTTFKPQPLNIIYLQDNEGAKLVAQAMDRFIPPHLSPALGATTLEPALPWSDAAYPVAQTKSLQQSGIPAEVMAIQSVQQGRIVTLQLDGDDTPVSATTVLIPADSQLQTITWQHREMVYRDAQTLVDNYYLYQCMGQSCGQQTLQLRFAKADSTVITIATHYDGLPPTLHDLAQTRDGLSIQRQQGDQTIILNQVTL